MIKTVKHYLTAITSDYEPTSFCLYPHDMQKAGCEGYLTIGEQSVELDIPDDFDPRPAQISAPEAQKQKARADFELLMNTLEGSIQSLRCIEHKPAADIPVDVDDDGGPF